MTPERTPFEMTTSDGIRIVGDASGDGAPVLLVHGLGFQRRHWHRQVVALTEAGYRPLTFDMRGFGDSELPENNYDMHRLAQDLEEVCAALGLDTFHLVGHSLGGMVCLQYALNNLERIRSLTICSSTAHNGERASRLGQMMHRLSREGSEKALADTAFRTEVEALVSSVVKYVAADQMLPLLASLTARPDPARSLAWLATAGFSIRSELARIKCPTMVLHGDMDPLMPFAAGILMATGVGNARWVPVYGGMHNIPREKPDQFNQELIGFLQLH